MTDSVDNLDCTDSIGIILICGRQVCSGVGDGRKLTSELPRIRIAPVGCRVADCVMVNRLAFVGGQLVAPRVAVSVGGCSGRAGDGIGLGVGVLRSASLLLRVGRLF